MTYANKNFKVVITNMFRTTSKKKEPKGGSEMKNQVGLTAERGYGRKNNNNNNKTGK